MLLLKVKNGASLKLCLISDENYCQFSFLTQKALNRSIFHRRNERNTSLTLSYNNNNSSSNKSFVPFILYSLIPPTLHRHSTDSRPSVSQQFTNKTVSRQTADSWPTDSQQMVVLYWVLLTLSTQLKLFGNENKANDRTTIYLRWKTKFSTCFNTRKLKRQYRRIQQ